MNQTQPGDQDLSRPSGSRFLLLAVIVLMAIGMGYLYLQGQAERQRSQGQAVANADLQKELANLKDQLSDVRTAELYRQEEQSVARDSLLAASQRGHLAKDRIGQLERAAADWQTAYDELLDSEPGRRIASDWQLVEQFYAAAKHDVSPDGLPEELNSRLATLTAPVEQALTEEIAAFQPGEELLARIAEIEQQARDAAEALQRSTRDLKAVAEKAERQAVHPEMTLRQAVAELQQHWDSQRAEKEQQALAEAREQNSQLLAEAKAEAERIIADAEAKAAKLVGEQMAARIVGEAEEEKQRQEEAEKERQAKLAREKLEADFDRELPTIKLTLKPLLDDGYTYRGDAPGKGPVSYSLLEGKGALRSDRKGMEALLYVAGTNTNDRPRGSFPQYVGSEFAWRKLDKDLMAKAQGYLTKYGELMVEKGLLAP